MAIVFNPFTGGFDFIPSPTFPGTLVIASGKTATVNNTLTLSGTDGTTMTFPTSSATVARTDAAQTFIGTQTFSGQLLVPNGAAATPGVRFTGYATGLYDVFGNGTMGFTVNGFGLGYWSGNELAVTSGSFYIGNNTGFIGLGSATVRFYYDATGVAAQRNGTAAQTFNLGNTVTTPMTAGEWFTIDWQTTANVVNLQAVRGSSSGTARVMTLSYGGLKASPVPAITIPITSGNIVFGGGVQLSNAAVTGLTPGALAALTTATIVLYDSTGQAYRVPCVI